MSHEASSILDFILLAVASSWSSWTAWPGTPGDVLNLVHELEEKGTSLKGLEPAIDTGGSMGWMVLTVLGMVAEMELGFIRNRQRAGIEAAKAKGVYKGRPATFDRARIVALRKEGMGAPLSSLRLSGASEGTSTRRSRPPS
jgi:DNA invertase Pin-like site-specific DNA recombinase